jgi:hypothetical protein
MTGGVRDPHAHAMNILSRIACAALCVVALTALSQPTQLTPPASMPAVAHAFEDQRDPKLFRSAAESLSITNCAYGSMRLGERDIDPDLPVLLNAMLGQRFGERLAGKRVSLQAFAIHVNRAAQIRAVNARMMTGLISEMMNDVNKLACAPVDLRGGYVTSEVPPGAVPLIVVIDLRIDDEAFRARSIAPLQLGDTPMKRSDPEYWLRWNAEVDAAVQTALAALGDQIEQRLFVAAATSPLPAEADTAPVLSGPAVPPAPL